MPADFPVLGRGGVGEHGVVELHHLALVLTQMLYHSSPMTEVRPPGVDTSFPQKGMAGVGVRRLGPCQRPELSLLDSRIRACSSGRMAAR